MEDKQSHIITAELLKFHINQQPLSGLKVQQYRNEHSINKSTFYYWMKKLSEAHQSTGEFIELHPTAFSQGNMTIHFSNTVSICFEVLPPLDYLKQLIQ